MEQRDIYIATTTLSSASRAEEMAEGSVSLGLAACAQVEGPIHSHYRWNNSLNRDKEWRVTFKTCADRLPKLTAWVHQNHTYDTPQWIAWRADVVSDDYAAFIRALPRD